MENLPLEWDSELGQKITEPYAALHNFSFPFSGKKWDGFAVGITGSLRFGEPDHPPGSGNGHAIFRADRTKVTIEEVIAAEGSRLPSGDRSQREFNTEMVIVVQHGQKPSRELLERAEGIHRQWTDYSSMITGHRASMTANPL